MKTYRPFACALALAALIPATLTAQNAAIDAYTAGTGDMKAGNFDAAVTDFTRALQADPNRTEACCDRGFAYLHTFDAKSAIADFSRAIALKVNYANAYYGRALAEQTNGDLNAAVSDYGRVIQTDPPGGDNPHFYLWLARVQLGQKDDADKELSDYMSKRPATASWWYTDIGKYLLGQMSENDLLTTAVSVTSAKWRDTDQCEAWYFVGMKKLIAGDKTSAADYFKKCLSANQSRLTETVLAHAESQTLELNP